MLNTFTQKVQAEFDALAANNATTVWRMQQIEELLQGTKVIRVRSGLKDSWEDILLPYLPDGLQTVDIYDRYLRNRYQLKSLSMFLDALTAKASSNGIKVNITTTEEENNVALKERFKHLQQLYVNKNITLHYTVLESSQAIPHFRKIEISSESGKCSLWLDKGFDIFEFKDVIKPIFSTIDTYPQRTSGDADRF